MFLSDFFLFFFDDDDDDEDVYHTNAIAKEWWKWYDYNNNINVDFLVIAHIVIVVVVGFSIDVFCIDIVNNDENNDRDNFG